MKNQSLISSQIFKRIYRICMIAALLLCISAWSQKADASTAGDNAVAAYNNYINKYLTGEWDHYKIIDIDKNGIPELICMHDLNGRVYTYNKSKKKMVKIGSRNTGKEYGPYYNQKNHTVILYCGSTGNEYYYVYKISGAKGKLIATYKMDVIYPKKASGRKKFSYKINGKKVSSNTFSKKVDKLIYKNKNVYETYYDYWYTNTSQVRKVY